MGVRLLGTRISFAVSTLVAVAACACTPGPFGDDQACTLIGCVDILNVTVLWEDNAVFEDGTYLFAMTPIEGQGVQASCTLASGALSCDGGEPDVTVEKNDSTTGFFVKLLTDWWLMGIAIRVELNGQLLGEEQFYPEYQIVTPNGPECEPTCFQASIPMELERPADGV